MKIPAGKRVYVGSKLFRAGSDLPDAIAEKAGLVKKITVPKVELIKTIKVKEIELTGTDRRGPRDDA